jgi:hypothetical protein
MMTTDIFGAALSALLQIGQRIGALIEDLRPELLLDDREHIGIQVLCGAGGAADDDLLACCPDKTGRAEHHSGQRTAATLQGGAARDLRSPHDVAPSR